MTDDPHDVAAQAALAVDQDPLAVLDVVVLLLSPLQTTTRLSSPSRQAVENALAATRYAIRAAHTPG